ncbi:MAG: AmmeMemoRadiSam system protein B [Magnetococcales bacterium]|nr:AmmeMemoRadiSam system protein B [Magnetococcales bacterium]
MSDVNINRKPKIRPATIAGIWYPKDPIDLAEKVDGLLDSITPDKIPMPVQALLVPHAGYDFSGKIMAEAFRHIKGYAFKRVVVIAPAIDHNFHGLCLPSVDKFQTPLGEINVDHEVLDELTKYSQFQNSSAPHEREHGIEILLPFLQQTLGNNWKIVPILTSGMGKQDFTDAANAIKPFLGGEDLLVVSGDLTHYGPDHGFVPFPADDKTEEKIKELDKGVVDHIMSWDPNGLAKYSIDTKIKASILAPAILMLNMLNGQCVPFHFRYDTSSKIANNPENSISYCSGVFMGPVPISEGDDNRDLKGMALPTLHKIAMRTLKLVVQDEVTEINIDATFNTSQFTLSMRQKRGAFVLLSKNKQPRGYFGKLTPELPLFETVIDSTIKASRSHAFSTPVATDEFHMLKIQIQVLSSLSLVESHYDIELGRQGIAIEKGNKFGAYLPNYPIDKGWNLEETLNNLASKSGMAPNGWQQPDCHIMVFTTQTVDE